jgi:hypothetical protein
MQHAAFCPVLLISAEVLPGKISVTGLRRRAIGAPLMVIFPGESVRRPEDGGLSVLARY